MKRSFLLIIIIMGFVGAVNGQQYYNMWRGSGQSGQPEWLSNLALRTSGQSVGIDFTTANNCRGFVNGYGRWGFLKPSTTMGVQSMNNIINAINNLTIGAQGWICAEGFSVRTMDDRISTTLDLLSADGKSSVTSNGDSQGLHIRSAVGHKIYLYDQIYFDDKHWTSMGSGRNNDPTINNANDKMMRFGSVGGIGLWGTTGVNVNDQPQLLVKGAEIDATVPVFVKLGTTSLFFGKASGEQDGWIGTTTAQGLHLGTNSKSVVFLGADDNMYVGLVDEDVKAIRQDLKGKYKMFVSKGVLAEDYGIGPKSSWSDFVFGANYNLPKISEVDAFIRENNHLPDVPSAKQVGEEGYSQHDMNKILLQKIEELTLYTIQQQKEIEALKAQLQESKK